MSRKSIRRAKQVRSIVAVAGAERSEAEGAATIEAADVRRGRPGRRSTEERTRAVLELLAGKASVDQLARRFGVQAQTIERWREQALAGIEGALREGSGATGRERELERQVEDLEKTVTSLAIQRELLQRAAATNHRPRSRCTRPTTRCCARWRLPRRERSRIWARSYSAIIPWNCRSSSSSGVPV